MRLLVAAMALAAAAPALGLPNADAGADLDRGFNIDENGDRRPAPEQGATEAAKFAESGDHAQAAGLYGSLIGGGRADPKTLALGAFSAYNSGDMETANDWASRSLTADPDGIYAQMARTISKLSAKKMGSFMSGPQPARPPPEETAREDRRPDSGPPAEAEPRLEDPAAGLPPSEVRLAEQHSQEARTALIVGDFEGAVKQASLAVSADPDDARALNLRATALLRLGRFSQARADAGRALDLAHGNSTLLLVRAMAAGRDRDFAAAKQDASAVLRARPDHPAALRLLAFAQAGLGERAGVLDTFRRAGLRPPPDDQDLNLLFTDAFLLTGAQPERRAEPRRRSLPMFFGGALLAAGIGVVVLLYGRRGREEEAEPVLLDESVIGPYRLVGTLGAGGMGVVYKAHDTALDRIVALKKMRDEIAADPRERERFIKEARIVSALDHPGIVRIHTVFEAPQGTFLVFEHVEGRTLSDLLGARGLLPFAEARAILGQACAAVAYAHSKGVIHRDLKPSNVMLDGSGRVRVMDFGIARASKDALTRLTAQAPSTVAGTPPYMSPEQEEGRAAPASDVYALAVCLYEMLSGRLPFSGSGMALYQAKREGRFAPLLPHLGASAPREIDDILARALQPDPARRLGSPLELSAALDGAAV